MAAAILAAIVLSGCSRKAGNLVNPLFIDSLISHYQPSQRALAIDSNLSFWKKRMDEQTENYVNGPKYAAALLSSFQLHGSISDLRKADSLLKRSNEANQEKEPGLWRSLASLAMLQHRFAEADSFAKKAIAIEGRSLPNHVLEFDVTFERGDYKKAKNLLSSIAVERSFGYLFRQSKFEHYNGSLDSAISCMLQAADKAGNNTYLKQSALSNAADLYLHKGNAEKAASLYMECIKNNPEDYHSLSGLGWLALVHDQNDSLAEKIFVFVHQHLQSPDALLKLEQVAEARNDSLMQKRYAEQFAKQAGDSIYGLMYSKYLVDLYTGILNDPGKAVVISEQETINRPTPQTFAWYVWSLYTNGEKDKAYLLFKNFVSGKPLEGPELYYMGCMMKGLGKNYNAKEYFKAAWKNRYDLSPAKIRFTEENK